MFLKSQEGAEGISAIYSSTRFSGKTQKQMAQMLSVFKSDKHTINYLTDSQGLILLLIKD
jgi:hypothetical protein